MRVLVTGATGFIGSAILSRLAQEGLELHGVNRSGIGPATATWHAVDLRDPHQASGIIHKVRPTHVLHSAWDVTPGRFWNDPGNLDWASSSMQLACATAGIGARFVGVGTCAEYDWSGGGILTEDKTPIVPLTPYGRAKALVWEYVSTIPNSAWGRVFMPYGPGDNPKRLIPSVTQALEAGVPIDLTSGRQRRDFIHVDDVAELFVRLLLSDRTGAFNVGTGVATTVRAVCEAIAARLNADPALLLFGAKPEPIEPLLLVADTAKTENALVWRAIRRSARPEDRQTAELPASGRHWPY